MTRYRALDSRFLNIAKLDFIRITNFVKDPVKRIRGKVASCEKIPTYLSKA